ncbi:hypothetical protein [Cystobacter fuscus]|uniref:hypothetical protein n=1 Tax=Cystobacter fuscus TaxID=43 RepID=UPI0005BD038E|nr:hypothetical protein [Cystobacter fuscus]
MKKIMILAVTLSASVVMAEPMNLYRVYNGDGSDHFYTTNFDEMIRAVNGAYDYEGVAGRCHSTQEAGTVPLYRLYKGGSTNDHFYTASWQERDLAIAQHKYVDEGVACYVYPQQQPGTCPFYRLWGHSDHFYTQSWQEAVRAVGSYGYSYEGVAGYLSPASGACPN